MRILSVSSAVDLHMQVALERICLLSVCWLSAASAPACPAGSPTAKHAKHLSRQTSCVAMHAHYMAPASACCHYGPLQVHSFICHTIILHADLSCISQRTIPTCASGLAISNCLSKRSLLGKLHKAACPVCSGCRWLVATAGTVQEN